MSLKDSSKHWRLVDCHARQDAPRGDTIFSDIFEGDELIAERISTIEAEKVVNRHNETLNE